jgi:putative DNA primase/helicase
MSKSESLLRHAIAIAKQGIRVFPCKESGPQAKAPYTRHGVKDATTDLKQIYEWWTLLPYASIACPTGKIANFCVIDIDQGEGKDGEESFAKLGLDQKTKTWQVRTPSGGRHLYFRYPCNFEVYNDAGRILGPWIDIRGEGGYIIVPPSCRENGAYSYIEGYEPWNTELAPLPDVIQKRIMGHQQGASEYAKKHLVRCELLSPIAEGERNQQLARRCGYLIKKLGVSMCYQVHLYLHEINQNCCQPPLDAREVDTIVRSIAKREARHD